MPTGSSAGRGGGRTVEPHQVAELALECVSARVELVLHRAQAPTSGDDFIRSDSRMTAGVRGSAEALSRTVGCVGGRRPASRRCSPAERLTCQPAGRHVDRAPIPRQPVRGSASCHRTSSRRAAPRSCWRPAARRSTTRSGTARIGASAEVAGHAGPRSVPRAARVVVQARGYLFQHPGAAVVARRLPTLQPGL